MDIVFHKQFNEKFGKLPMKIQNKFYERLSIFIKNNYDSILKNHSIDPVFPNCRSINITDDYRAIFKESDNRIIFITIGTHSELY